jgi:hypothetical protein
MNMKRLSWVFLFAILAACATAGPGGAPENFVVQVPQQWKKLNVADCSMYSKEGPFAQYIFIQQRPVGQEFPHAKKALSPGMTPKQVSDLFLQEIASDPGVLHLRVLEIHPAKINSYDGFKAVFTYNVKDGYRFKTMLYGFLQGDWFYGIRYNADVKKYSNEDVRTFEKIVKTFALKGA